MKYTSYYNELQFFYDNIKNWYPSDNHISQLNITTLKTKTMTDQCKSSHNHLNAQIYNFVIIS